MNKCVVFKEDKSITRLCVMEATELFLFDYASCSYVTGVLYPLLFGKEYPFSKSVP